MIKFVSVVGGDVKNDDVHLILEYKAGESWGPFTTNRANRSAKVLKSMVK
jgi:hypothetical protein